ncbi:Na+/H+ antiporter NhaC [Psychroflexus torquis ATCC 700755]|uniref:Na+/H+ antiporter NhaC n=1 Tax=Psychroflexus torquis (strain ATCC 700755 / CIP 106069 / ACAM 623) TaxID=313595 RepID=K4II48_PSYTT|nr:Na+/H+ antiporter NhaC [Psychroflexus torquis]AFU69994.1 Na+/H+ antiporter NhaC [Psychroflexus torquis ATCC 700755]
MSEASNDTEEIQSNSKIRLSIWQALIPIIALIGMLAYNVFIYGDDSLGGSNQFILLMGGAVAAIVGVVKGVKFEVMIEDVAKNIKATAEPILILLMVGSLAGTWLLSGIIPTMIYYGLQILNPTIFLAATVVICSVISIATGSSWTTSATVGIALIGIAEALGVSVAMTAGAVLSGGYFGDKLSPMSDTTNLAPAMAGTDLFTHIRYMTLTTVPTIIVTLIAFIIIGLNLDTSGQTNPEEILGSIDASFNITPWLFVVPVIVIALIIKKTPPLIALLLGTLLAAGAALIFQPDLVQMIGGGETLNFETAYRGIINAITVEITIPSENESLQDLFSAGGMAGMLGTIWLIICAMVFGGIMDAIGALERISEALLNLFTSIFGLFFSTVTSCLVLNLTASDQYLAIVVPGKMFAKAYEKKGLAPENLSRTLEDSGTVTSVLIPWNTCGAYHSGVLGVPVADYFFYAIFNYLSPFVTLIFAAFNIKIKQLTKK